MLNQRISLFTFDNTINRTKCIFIPTQGTLMRRNYNHSVWVNDHINQYMNA